MSGVPEHLHRVSEPVEPVSQVAVNGRMSNRHTAVLYWNCRKQGQALHGHQRECDSSEVLAPSVPAASLDSRGTDYSETSTVRQCACALVLPVSTCTCMQLLLVVRAQLAAIRSARRRSYPLYIEQRSCNK